MIKVNLVFGKYTVSISICRVVHEKDDDEERTKKKKKKKF